MNIATLSKEPYVCPGCGGIALDVCITTWARLEQTLEDGKIEFSTDTGEAQFQDHEWDDQSLMRCRKCGHTAESFDFEVAVQQEKKGLVS